MRILFVALIALAGCSKSRCEKYADMEIKCGGYPKAEEDITRAMAEGACESMDKNDKLLGAHIQHEADCAAKHMNDCAAYKACTEAEPK